MPYHRQGRTELAVFFLGQQSRAQRTDGALVDRQRHEVSDHTNREGRLAMYEQKARRGADQEQGVSDEARAHRMEEIHFRPDHEEHADLYEIPPRQDLPKALMVDMQIALCIEDQHLLTWHEPHHEE